MSGLETKLPCTVGAVHKIGQNFFRGEGSKIEGKVLTDRYKKVLTCWRGVSNIAKKKVLTYFMDGPVLSLSSVTQNFVKLLSLRSSSRCTKNFIFISNHHIAKISVIFFIIILLIRS